MPVILSPRKPPLWTSFRAQRDQRPDLDQSPSVILQVRPGDRMFAVETENGVLLTPYDPGFHDAMQAFAEVRRQYRNTLKKLAE
jgi:hypothetical protein